MQPPKPKKIPHVLEKFGDRRIDYYYYFREKDNPYVIEHLKRENEYTRWVMRDTEELQEKLYRELLSYIKEDDETYPVKWGNYYYFKRYVKGKNYPIYLRTGDPEKRKDAEVLLDLNEVGEKHEFVDLAEFIPTLDGSLIAYLLDTSGGENYHLYIMDARTKEIVDKVEKNISGVLWLDGKTLLYTVETEETKRPYRVYKHTLGKSGDELLFEEKDEAYFLSIGTTEDEEYVIVHLGSADTTEEWYAKKSPDIWEFKLLYPRKKEVRYYASHRDGYFYIMTNENAKNFKIVAVPVEDPSKENWKEIIPEDRDVPIESFILFRDFMAINERRNGLPAFRIYDFKTGETHNVQFPEPTYFTRFSSGGEFPTAQVYDSPFVRIYYSSLSTPPTIYDYHYSERKLYVRKEQEVPGYDKSKYVVERIWATSHDGTKVPISLVYRKDLFKRDGSNPMLLEGYGAYGYPYDAGFRTSNIPLLDRGIIFAIAHVRGGGEFGDRWHDEGKLLKKKNTIYDFIACTEHLIREKYTGPEKIAIRGGSAGGILIGGAINERPDLYRVAIGDVPFVDVLTTMLDPTLPLTVTEYDEWGNPNIEEYYWYIKSYSPYDNVKEQKYPHVLATGGLNDPRVRYWEPAKWVAKLRDHNRGDTTILLKINMGAGHFGPSGRYRYYRDEVAFKWAYILKFLGIEE